MSKTSRLDREIAEALAPPVPTPRAAPVGGLIARRARNFRDSGNYEVRDEAGTLVALLFRDPDDRGWYEEGLPGEPQAHYATRWRGSTQAEALERIAGLRRRGDPTLEA